VSPERLLRGGEPGRGEPFRHVAAGHGRDRAPPGAPRVAAGPRGGAGNIFIARGGQPGGLLLHALSPSHRHRPRPAVEAEAEPSSL
jgi:hypothetical protein